MTAHLTINGIEFQTLPVPARTAEAILSMPLMMQGAWSDVYFWDARTGQGRAGSRVTQGFVAPLPNALVFYVPRIQPNGTLVQNEAASAHMADRFLALVEAGSAEDLNSAIARMVLRPQKTLPLEAFAPFNAVCSYRIRMHVGFAVIQLRHPGEDLTAYLCLPSRVSFHAEIDALVDSDGYQNLVARQPALRSLKLDFVVPARSPANKGLRQTALRLRIEELRSQLAKTQPANSKEAGVAADLVKEALNRAEGEWAALSA